MIYANQELRDAMLAARIGVWAGGFPLGKGAGVRCSVLFFYYNRPYI